MIPLDVHWAVWKLPAAVAMIKLTTLAAPICQVVAAKVSTLKWKRRERKEPTAKEIAARARMMKPAMLRWSGGRSGAVEGGPEEGEHADGSEQGAEPAEEVEGFAAGEGGFDEGDHDGDHGDDERGVAGGDHGLGPDEEDVVGRHEQDADQAQLPCSAARYAETDATGKAEGGKNGRRNERAQGSNERRRDVQACDMDGEVGRAPDEIHKGEGHGDAALVGQREGHLPLNY